MKPLLPALLLALPLPALAATPDTALVMAYNIDAISTFDPAQVAEVVTDEILTNTCDALVDFDPGDEANFIPSLAERWDVAEDGQTITFHLKEGLVFPDGTPATARDLIWSMHRVLSLGYGNAAQLTDFGFTAENMAERITAPDDRTVILSLDRPYPVNLVMGSIGANRVSFLLNRAEIEPNAQGEDMGNAWLGARTACVGPYTLARWNSGESVMLEASERYAGPAPALPRILIRHVAEPGTQRLMLQHGDVDIARNLNPDDLVAVAEMDGLRVDTALKPSMFYMAMNLSQKPFDDPKVRLAMRYLIDYQGLGDTVMNGIGVPRASFVQLGAYGALDEEAGQPFNLDIEKARALLAEAGYPEGFTVSLILGSHAYADPIAQTIQEAAAKVGVTFQIERMANSQLFAKTRAREFQAAMLGFKTSVPDAHGMASRHVANPDNGAGAGLGQYPSWRSAYHDPAMNARVEDALFERDPATRTEMYHQLQRDVMQDGPQAYIMQTMESAALSDAVTEWTWNGFRTYYDLAAK
ncbi:ABC transporter substrate-binding protein [Falsirhodobacter sp. 1013]|uniref:ABC transporter substrate-binding protein n=1 Tax=Falsirhodobacter sp. 1013 TaxID=3417566 RepID=UPI003EBE0E2B